MARKKRTEEQQARQFGWALAGLLVVLAAAFHFLGGHTTRAWVALGAAAVVIVVRLALFSLWLRFFRVWMKFAHALGTVMTAVILTLFYFLIFTPIVLAMRVFGKRHLDLSWKDGRSSYWIDKADVPATLERYQKQF